MRVLSLIPGTEINQCGLVLKVLGIITFLLAFTFRISHTQFLFDPLQAKSHLTSQSIATGIDDLICHSIAYNNSAGVYLVRWEEILNDLNKDIYAPRVNASSVLQGSDIISTSSVFESAPYVTFNPHTNEYLVAWQSATGLYNNVLYMQCPNGSALPIGGAVPITSSVDDELISRVDAYPWRMSSTW